MKWNTLVENQIKKAKSEGQLEKLAGEGQPLPKRECGDIVSAAMGIMANAGVVPREIQLKKDVIAQQQELKVATDPVERKKIMRKLADLQMHLGIEQDARRKFYSI